MLVLLQFLELDFMPNPPRGCSYFYGSAAIVPFLVANDLMGIVRAHQCKEEGVGFSYMNNRVLSYIWPYVTTVFSASNYCGSHGNRGAVLLFYDDDIQVRLRVWLCCFVLVVLSFVMEQLVDWLVLGLFDIL